jgi:Transposase DDE domain
MTEAKLLPISAARKLFQYVPDTDLSRLVAVSLALAKSHPYLLDMIERDLDAMAIAKKKDRLEDQAWRQSRSRLLKGFDLTADDDWLDHLEVGTGRPRTPAIVVFLFLALRGWFGGFKDRKVATLLAESQTIDLCLTSLGCKLPGASTLIDNANAVSNATREAILNVQIHTAKSERLDTFESLTFDSTKVEANSAFPTDSILIMGLVERAEHGLRLLADHGIKVNLPQVMKTIAIDIRLLNKEIQLSSGKKNSAKKRGKLYRKLMRLGRKAKRDMSRAHDRANAKFAAMDIIPSQRRQVNELIDSIEADLRDLGQTIRNADKRINRDVKVPVEQKVLSLADDDAAMIVKGERTPVVGYRPQIGRSENGFIVAIIVPEGNAADSGQLRPIVDASIKRTGILPTNLSFDDGYTNREDRVHYLRLGVKVVSFSGSKGKNLIPAEEYESEAYRATRNDRSAIESLIYTIKHNHGFDRLMRRGISNVRAELLEKAIAYNFFRLLKTRFDRVEKKRAA